MASCQALEQHESRVAAQLFRHELNNRYVYINAECIAVTKWTVYCCQFTIISMTQGIRHSWHNYTSRGNVFIDFWQRTTPINTIVSDVLLMDQ